MVDFEKEEPSETTSDGSTISSISSFVPKQEIELDKNKTRRWVAYFLLGIFLLEVLAAFVGVLVYPQHIDKILQLLAYVMTPTITLLGNVSAYYFGSRGADNEAS